MEELIWEFFNFTNNSIKQIENFRTAVLNLDIEKIKNNEREMGIAQGFWKKIVYLDERVLQNLMKETTHSDTGQLNYLFIDIAKQMLNI